MLNIKSTEDSPAISCNTVKGQFLMEGRSLLEDPQVFYSDLISWFVDHVISEDIRMELQFKVDYFNSSSSRYLLKLLMLLNQNPERYKMIWFVEEGDEVIFDKGEEFQMLLDFPVAVKEYNPN